MRPAIQPSVRYQTLLQLLRTADTIWDASHTFFAPWNLGPSQFNVLNLLFGLPNGLSQTEVGRKLIMHRSNITGLVDRLEKRGLVERKALAGDRRVCRVVLTTEGARIMEEVLPMYYQKAEEVWGDCPAKVLAEISSRLNQVAQNAARIAQESGPGKT
jgi:DNA-binding MarR family transcriptional regulator